MKKILCCFLSVIMFFGCLGIVSCKDDTPQIEIDDAVLHYDSIIWNLKRKLKDPDSLRIDYRCCYEITSIDTESALYDYIKGSVDVGDYVYEIKYNAKNSFGGYGSPTTIYVKYSADGSTENVSLWVMGYAKEYGVQHSLVGSSY